MSWYSWAMVSMVLVVLAGGCFVSPELQAKVEAANAAAVSAAGKAAALAAELKQLEADYKSGKLDALTFGQVKDRLTTAWEAAKGEALDTRLKYLEVHAQAKAEGVSGWSVAGAVALNLILRLVGVPGFASASGGSLVTVAKGLAGKASGAQ